MVEGIVVKSLNVWFHVHTGEDVLLCRPRGRFKVKSGSAPAVLVGDRVRCAVLPDGSGSIEEVLPRRNRLVRPPVANVDQVLVVFTYTEPPLNLDLVDRILVAASREGLAAVLILNKVDLITGEELPRVEAVLDIYRQAGYTCLATSALHGSGMEDVARLLAGGTTVMAGPSGAGKTSLLNALRPGMNLRTGEVGARGQRGRHTTRNVELLALSPDGGEGAGDGGWIADAPGFSRLDLNHIPEADLAAGFPEMAAHAGECRFRGCLHEEEPGCAVTAALAAGTINAGRYERYRRFLDEIRRANPYNR